MGGLSASERAANLLADEFFQSQMEAIEGVYLSQITNSDDYDAEGRERAFVKLRALREIRAHFESLAQQSLIEKRRWKIL